MACELYRHFDISGRLLYVGISGSTFLRLTKGHKGSAPWFDQIASITVEKFDTREEAIAAERRAIKAEKPPYNITHKGDDKQIEMELVEESTKPANKLEQIRVNRAGQAPEIQRVICGFCCEGYQDECSWNCFNKVRAAGWITDCEASAGGKWRGVDCYGQRIAVTGELPSRQIVYWPIGNRLLAPYFLKRRA